MMNTKPSDLHCLVTGATSGVGEAIATKLAAQGAQVLAVARSTERGEAAVARIRHVVPDALIEVMAADLSVMGEVESLADRVTGHWGRLDVLILNAGVARPRRELTPDGLEVDFATNHLSAFLLTQRLRDLLCASAPARVVTISSSGHKHVKAVDFDGLATGENFHHMRTYSTTKLLTILFTTELARRLEGSGVTANAADPGFVRTRLGRDAPPAFGLFLKAARIFQLCPEKAATTPVYLATSPEPAGDSGRYYAKSRPTTPSSLAQDQTAAARLWSLSNGLLTRKAQR